MAADNIQQGLNALSKLYNCFPALLKNKNAGSALLKIYKEMDVDGFRQDWPTATKGNYTFNFTYIELLIAQDQIAETLSNEERKELKNIAVGNFDLKNSQKLIYGTFGLNTSALILAKLIRLDEKEHLIKNFSKPRLDTYLNTATFSEEGLLEDIYNASKSY